MFEARVSLGSELNTNSTKRVFPSCIWPATRRCVRRRAQYDGRDPGGDRRSDCRGVITKKIRKEDESGRLL